MSTSAAERTLEERIYRLEDRVCDESRAGQRLVDAVEGRLVCLELLVGGASPLAPPEASLRAGSAQASGVREPRARSRPTVAARQARQGSAAHSAKNLRVGELAGSAAADTPTRTASLSDLVGGRVLAWLGGVATLLGIVLFLGLAISHGWIGELARVLLAGVASATLLGAGVWLHDRRGRTETAVVMVGAGTAGLFATLIVAGEIYRLSPPLVSLGALLAVGALATMLAIRWAGRAIGALGLGGALLAPVVVGAPSGLATIAVLLVAAACAMWVVAWQQWRWLGVGTVLVCAPQWAVWALDGQPLPLALLVLAGFCAVGLLGGVAADLRSVGEQRSRASIAVLVANACIVTVTGYFALRQTAGTTVAEIWLVSLAGVHAVIGFGPLRLRLSREVRGLLGVLAVILADLAFALSAHGIVLAIGWGASAIAFALVSRRSAPDQTHALLDLGMGAHITLVLIRALLDAPPDQVGAGAAGLVSVLSVSTLAASSLACAHLTHANHSSWRGALDAVGLLAVAYLTAGALDGAALVVAWALEGLALNQLARRTSEPAARIGAVAFIGAAALHTFALEAPPGVLLTGTPDLGAATLALATLAGVALRTAWSKPVASATRQRFLGAGAVSLLYLASMTIITAFQPASGDAIDTVLDLSVRQQGQVLLSALWALAGLAALITGLRARHSPMRTAALALLLVTVGKVFLYDLATLTSIYRVASFLVLGILLLTAGFAYQRQRPPPQPDLRTLHPSQR